VSFGATLDNWITGYRRFSLDILKLEDEDTTLVRNVGIRVPTDALLSLSLSVSASCFSGELDDDLLPVEDKAVGCLVLAFGLLPSVGGGGGGGGCGGGGGGRDREREICAKRAKRG
jgi:hypothetical protein